MKTQFVGWFFCALFCSSIAHDWLRGQASLLEARSSQLSSVDSKLLDTLRHVQEKSAKTDLSGQTGGLLTRTAGSPIKYYCPVSNPNLIVIADVTGNLCIVIDIVNSIFLLCDGNAGTALIYNVASSSCKYVPVGAWTASVVSLKVWVSTLSLAVIGSLITNIVVNVSNPSLQALTLCQTVTGSLDIDLYIKVQTNLNGCLSLTISLCTEIIACLKVTLAGLIKLTTVDYVIIKGGLMGFIEICRGLIDLCVTANIIVADVVAAAVILDILLILEASDGLACFAYVCGQIGAKFDLVTCLNVVVTNISIFVRICVRLGGNLCTGVNGVFRVVAAVIALTVDSITLDACLLIILNVCANVSGQLSITAAIASIQALISAQTSLWNNEAGLAILIGFIGTLNTGTCNISNINISLIITTLCGGIATTVLDLCVDIVICVTAYTTVVLTVNLYYATLLRVVLFLLNDISGRILINILIPGLNIPIVYSNVCLNLLDGLLLTITQVLLVLGLQGLVKCLQTVPILTQIYNSCNTVILAKISLKLDVILNSNSASAEYTRISAWINTITACGCA